MFRKDDSTRDGFTLSLGGTTVITSVVAAPVVAGDRLNQLRDAEIEKARERGDRKRASWFPMLGRTA